MSEQPSPMAALNSNPTFALLRQVRTLPTTCPKHPDTHMIQLKDQPAFCPKCQAEKIASEDAKRVKVAMTAQFHREHKGALKLDSIFDDDEVLENSFDNFEAEKGSEAYENWMQARRIAAKYLNPDYVANTILTGNPGTGKTHLAMGMLNAVNSAADPEMRCIFLSVNEAVRRVKASFNDKDSWYTEENVTQLAGDADLLVLDDLGSEAVFRNQGAEASDWVQQFLFGILNKRRGRTIITSNLTSTQMTNTYNGKILSRMFRGTKSNSGLIRFTAATSDKRLEMF